VAGAGRFKVELNRRLAQFKWVLDLDNIAVSVKPLVAFLAPVSLEIQNRLLEVWHLGPKSFSEPNRTDAMRILENSDRFAALRRAMLISVAAEHQPAAALSDKCNQPAELRHRNHRHLIQNNNRAGVGVALELQVGLEFLKGHGARKL